ncbi:IS110 family transposase [Micromonospora sp. WMMD980]|uniref:IS110 family transposase n=1 Tax=Micromonospora sp. WMMD980 TaxID=3016088 RepID=UPI002416E031|nr:IS110 family transposase [Micromonospora sp. WMMD980]MDG4803239.1 IS110 family transposase [Micromonospora sp. WMMD980]
MGSLWAGVDVGKTHHHVCVVDDDGTVVVSEKIPNDQRAISGIAGRLGKRRKSIRWAVDLRGGPAALLLAVLFDRNADVRYVSGTVTSRMAEAFHGERKTDAHDAYVIAQTLRMRGDLPTLTVADGVQQQLKLLVSRRLDLVADRVRITARIQDLLTMISPALEKALNLRSKGALRLLAQWQTPAGLRRAGEARILDYLREHGVRAAKALTAKVLTAARTQTANVAGEATAAGILAQMAADLEAVNDRIVAIEETIAGIVAEHELGEIVTSLPGIGTTLAAEFLAHAGTLTTYPSAAALAAHAGLAPISRDSGRRQGHQIRPHRYHRGLRRVFSMSSFTALTHCPRSRAYYDKKRAEGKTHRQATAALSRQRLNVLWACIRDKRPYQPKQPRSAELVPCELA